jgi:hypothetical protein
MNPRLEGLDKYFRTTGLMRRLGISTARLTYP